MRRIMTCGALLALLLVSTTGANSAQKELTGDQKFLKDTFTTSHAAVRLSELADKHSNNAKVKDFAKMVIKDHKEMNDKIAKGAAEQMYKRQRLPSSRSAKSMNLADPELFLRLWSCNCFFIRHRRLCGRTRGSVTP